MRALILCSHGSARIVRKDVHLVAGCLTDATANLRVFFAMALPFRTFARRNEQLAGDLR